MSSLDGVADAVNARAKAPVVDGGSSSRFGQSLLRIAAQACADAGGLSGAPRCVETHSKHEKHRNHVEEPGERERRKVSFPILPVMKLFLPSIRTLAKYSARTPQSDKENVSYSSALFTPLNA